MEAQTIRYAVEPLAKEENLEIMAQDSTIKVFDQVNPANMAEEQHKEHVVGLVYEHVMAGDKTSRCSKR